MSKKIKFLATKQYNECTFELNKVYELDDAFALRWLKRGCKDVSESYKGKCESDPRLAKKEKKEEVKEVKKEIKAEDKKEIKAEDKKEIKAEDKKEDKKPRARRSAKDKDEDKKEEKSEDKEKKD